MRDLVERSRGAARFRECGGLRRVDVEAFRRIARADQPVRQRAAEQPESRDADLPRGRHAAISFRIAQQRGRIGDVRIVACIDLVSLPALALRALVMLAEAVADAGLLRIDIGARCGGLGGKLELGRKRLHRLRHAARAGPCLILRRGVGRHRVRRNAETARARRRTRLHLGGDIRRHEVEHGLAIRGGERVEIDQPRHAVARPVGDAGRHHPAVGVADQVHVAQILGLQHRHDVLDVRIERHIRVAKMRALAEAGVGRGPQLVAGRTHQRAHLLPRPARGPGAVRHHECCHRRPSCRLRSSQIYSPSADCKGHPWVGAGAKRCLRKHWHFAAPGRICAPC